jgi:hypothetical protein
VRFVWGQAVFAVVLYLGSWRARVLSELEGKDTGTADLLKYAAFVLAVLLPVTAVVAWLMTWG